MVSPVQTLSKAQMEDIHEKSAKIANAIGVIGSINIKYAVNPATGDIVIIEINPRSSRSTSLAAKVSGFPAVYVAAKLAVGMTLDELSYCCGSFDPQKDVCMVKTSRFTFRKFPQSNNILDTSMKSIGEAVAVGSTFLEALQKAIRALEVGRAGLERRDPDYIREKLAKPTVERLSYIRYAIESGISIEEISERSKIDKWFIEKVNKLVDFEKNLAGKSIVNVPAQMLRNAKQMGYSDLQLAKLLETDEDQVRYAQKSARRHASLYKDFGLLP